MTINYPSDSTLIDEDEKEGLLLKHITTIEELNTAEGSNILEARRKLFSRRRKNWLTQSFIKESHKLMFGSVWSWAGIYRKTNKNIGVEWHQIQTELSLLLEDTQFWINSKMDKKELLARFHHRLVKIHPFPNGNGRHSSLRPLFTPVFLCLMWRYFRE